MKKKAFTLIELLIVVAIIAILAAIAVPNFLEAQTRSKTSRVKADMRSLATALEAYAVDYNRAIVGNLEAKALGIPTGPRDEWVWHQLTTPVAFMTSIPLDPFVEKAGAATGFKQKYFKYEYFKTYSKQYDRLRESKGIHWGMYSLGPQRSWNPVGSGWTAGNIADYLEEKPDTANQALYPSMIYDPTNGTVSYGYIIRTSRGQEPAK